MSVVLPCLNESTTATKTVMSFCNRTPSDVLEEIIVVDDGSTPPLSEVLLKEVPEHCRLRIQRHKAPVGLMGAKQTGGDHALGEFVGFYDCHVAPRRGWEKQTMQLLREKERRLVIPMIGTLDVTKWDEVPHGGSVGKCYMNWNADWWWYNDDSPYTPVISGGLVATTRNWWRDSGGFDSGMHGWGGENTETALRVWLCGGDVIRADQTLVAHMWRNDADKRTVARYKVSKKSDNVARVAAAWFDEFAHKFRGTGPDPGIDVTPVKELQKRLGCKPFVHFLHRFRQIYEGAGLLPKQVFHIRSMTSGKCLQRHDKSYLLVPCGESTWFHFGNQAPAQFPSPEGLEGAISGEPEDPDKKTVCGGHSVTGGCSKCPQGHGSEWCHGDCSWIFGSCIAKASASSMAFLPERSCCSGLREWNSLDCMENLRADPAGPGTALCDVAGAATLQHYSFESGGHIRHYSGLCISQDPAGGQYPKAVGAKCEGAHRFEIADAFEPEETRIYRESVLRNGLTDDLPDH
jgi:glycosyltransferase involved in cell wall biosynthesis